MLTALRGLPLGFFFVVEDGFAFLVTAFFGLIALATFFTLATAVLAVAFTTDTTFLAFDTDDFFATFAFLAAGFLAFAEAALRLVVLVDAFLRAIAIDAFPYELSTYIKVSHAAIK